jgi:hypothetical protein
MFGAGHLSDARPVSVTNEVHEQGVDFVDIVDAYNARQSEHGRATWRPPKHR